jgi:hypothetical protein
MPIRIIGYLQQFEKAETATLFCVLRKVVAFYAPSRRMKAGKGEIHEQTRRS